MRLLFLYQFHQVVAGYINVGITVIGNIPGLGPFISRWQCIGRAAINTAQHLQRRQNLVEGCIMFLIFH
ncbi:hypothetical protein A6U95_18530 [Serratia sp. 14-2641]|nr:hypothetical protein A6U95_18530 [Serratia sp. 14-2641]